MPYTVENPPEAIEGLPKHAIEICPICGKAFSDYISKGRKFCSMECFRIYRKGLSLKKRGQYEDILCIQCGGIFEALECLHRKFCSQQCKARWQETNLSGMKNPNWQGGASPLSHRVKQTIQWSRWRDTVFSRDNFICQICKQRGNHLEPHHIKSKQVYPELVFAVDNGITLCKKCHRDLHRAMPANQVIRIGEYPIKEGQYAVSNAG